MSDAVPRILNDILPRRPDMLALTSPGMGRKSRFMSEAGSSRRGRPPQDRATLKHIDMMGGLDYLSASYRKQVFPRHAHGEYLVGLIEAGVHDVWCRGELWHAGAGVVATLAPDEPHSGGVGSEEGWCQRILYLPEPLVRGVLEDAGAARQGTPGFHSPFQNDAELARILKRFAGLLDEGVPTLEVEEALHGMVLKLFAEGERPSRSPDIASAPLQRARDYLHAHLAEPIRLADLSAVADLSSGTLLERFKAQFGVPPHRYLVQRRVEEARRLLRRGAGIAEAAYEVGFADQSHLTRKFRDILGVTPAR